MTLRIIFFIGLILHSITNFAQEDLDDIFDDGKSTSDIQFSVSTDVITTIGGTVNLYGEAVFKEKAAIFCGLGVTPFGYLADFSNLSHLFDPNSAIQNNMSTGLFYDLGMKYLATFGSFSYYYYASLKHWGWQTASDPSIDNKNKRNKFNFGVGYAYNPIPKIGFDLHLGVYLGSQELNVIDSPYGKKSFVTGFDLGIAVKYNI